MSKPTVGSLFSGIGGLDLGLERAGFEIIWQSEIDPYASRVLAKHWPGVPNIGDITKIDWRNVERPDVVCGGFPCQPVSTAGKRLGQEDPRWLWPELARCLRDLRPRAAVMENVPGIFVPSPVRRQVGEDEWEVIGWLSPPFEEVLGDLATLGFDASWDCIPAALIGAPHLRYRVFVMAHAAGERESHGASIPDSETLECSIVGSSGGVARGCAPSGIHDVGRVTAGGTGDAPDAKCSELRDEPDRLTGSDGRTVARDDGSSGTLAHADAAGPQGRELLPERASERATWPRGMADADREGWREWTGALRNSNGARRESANGGRWFAESGMGGTPDGFPPRLDGIGRLNAWRPGWEDGVPRVATGVPHRVGRLRCLGNAVVPQVAQLIGEQLMAVLDRERTKA